VTPSLKDKVLEREELAEEELEKLFLRNICNEIMDEVMDQGGDHNVILPSGRNRSSGNRKGKKSSRCKK
jgi:hypothetical protein